MWLQSTLDVFRKLKRHSFSSPSINMSETRNAKRYALLVGIDLYFNNGAREQNRNTKLLSNNLQGCFNDVMGMESLLRKRHQLESIDILASPLQGIPQSTLRDSRAILSSGQHTKT
jgi:hypothetical protein